MIEDPRVQIVAVSILIPLLATCGAIMIKRGVIEGYTTVLSDLFLAVFILDIVQLIGLTEQGIVGSRYPTLWGVSLSISFMLLMYAIRVEGELVARGFINNYRISYFEEELPWWATKAPRGVLLVVLNLLIGSNIGLLYA